MRKFIYYVLVTLIIACNDDDSHSINDITAPIITVLGDTTISIPKNTIYIDAGATAIDNVDGVLTSSIITISNVDTSALGFYTVTYSVSDTEGNNSSASRLVTVFESPVVGDLKNGGYVVWVNPADPSKGLVSALVDQITDIRGVVWYDGDFNTLPETGATSTAIGTGSSNTDAIIVAQGSGSYAAQLCADYSVTVDGITYDDWFLPSKDELNLLYLQHTLIGGFTDDVTTEIYGDYYWSSSESSKYNAWDQDFFDGSDETSDKNYPNLVRAVRAY
jgi:hypothetical protein|tara:strand:- start:56 stop:883 length:828 start_codon:yes stop_codon:yes gene_type:complete